MENVHAYMLASRQPVPFSKMLRSSGSFQRICRSDNWRVGLGRNPIDAEHPIWRGFSKACSS